MTLTKIRKRQDIRAKSKLSSKRRAEKERKARWAAFKKDLRDLRKRLAKSKPLKIKSPLLARGASLTTKTKLSLQTQQKSSRKRWARLAAQAKAYDARQLAWQRGVDARLDALEKKAKKKRR